MNGQRIHAEAELEGGGSTWFYVCGECHGAVNYQAETCRHCGAILSWDGLALPGQRRKMYVVEHTEPAE